MIITKVDIPSLPQDNDGLALIKMDRLGKLVLIAGKNGSGKTRILKKIFKNFRNNLRSSHNTIKHIDEQIKIQLDKLNELKTSIPILEKELERENESLAQGGYLPTTGLGIEATPWDVEAKIEHNKERIKIIENEISELNNKKYTTGVYTDGIYEKYIEVNFVPKHINLTDNRNQPRTANQEHISLMQQVGIENIANGVFAKIQDIQDRWFNTTHQLSKVDKKVKKEAIVNYKKLQEIIELFLNTKIDRDINDQATIFGLPLGDSKLSDGQKILLQFCLALYSQAESLKDLILVLDEPENHIHPSILLETLDRILECVPDGQVWVSTHSISVLAHFDPSQLWFVENGKISYAGRIPEKVLGSLLGNENDISRLLDFLSLPSQLASIRYAFECLMEPKVVITNSNDPQTEQIRESLIAHSSNGKLRILDYGVGKGRLISNIAEIDEISDSNLLEKIDYIGFDKFDTDKTICELALIKAYGHSDNRYFNDFNNLFSYYDKESFDIVIMCNVLHEIDPIGWLSLFQKNGTISECLKDNGVLLLIEDQQIPIGEKAYQKGFLVLDTPHLKELFQITEKDENFKVFDKNKDGRLKAHQIPKTILTRINENSRLKAIEAMSRTAKDKIKDIREKEQNYKNGKLHGFWTQQFANAQLNIEEFSSKS